MADQGSGIMKKIMVKKSTLIFLYFLFYFFLSFCLIVCIIGAADDLGIINLEYINQEIDNDNWVVTYTFLIVCLVLPMWMAHILTTIKMERKKKVE